MCLAIPGKIVDTDEIGGLRIGNVQFGSITRQAFLGFVPHAQPGDYVLVHVGFAISKVDEEEAARTYQYLAEMDQRLIHGHVVDDTHRGLGIGAAHFLQGGKDLRDDLEALGQDDVGRIELAVVGV